VPRRLYFKLGKQTFRRDRW